MLGDFYGSLEKNHQKLSLNNRAIQVFQVIFQSKNSKQVREELKSTEHCKGCEYMNSQELAAKNDRIFISISLFTSSGTKAVKKHKYILNV